MVGPDPEQLAEDFWEPRPQAEVTNYDAYLALKQWHPSMTANLEASVNTGAQVNEILEKCREFTLVEVPEFVWRYVAMALEHLAVERNARRGMN